MFKAIQYMISKLPNANLSIERTFIANLGKNGFLIEIQNEDVSISKEVLYESLTEELISAIITLVTDIISIEEKL